ncbi:UNVERIFIED_CONTAM: FAD-containing oxidoreductase [Streptococcus canis]|uniref:Pyridine nucleotide-disulfide oxidoreductase n=1 Tax=Streptococcus canis FSL Z3-227 TaxID=482234 RepID=A0AAV3FUL3_STRCB|nr:FAD-containing oxidoreductase [Streptococcus canis]EIQ82619.1 pyridine nucleotide-disulfide oxidoreductase [Streptococcus canis FSL Z3-227]MDV5988701.1 FAD-containing oxidoreductase [Streptococcus canis]MDV5993707.1 FAD-containing oxidoreductase [Streptococcus canis]MDV6000949.1 FAD-containing oxidoreductase [Streptococcus canis]MDV6022514.1 FAD-containing oxidoreductase [Streptococcus canis]
MEKYDLIVIGFGKAGKTLAGKMAALGKRVALIEQNERMYGGTCINIGCIPTKSLIMAAESNSTFEQAMEHKDTVVSRLRQKNAKALTSSGAVLYNGKGSFLSNKRVQVEAGNDRIVLEGETIVINTGAVSNQFPIPGLADSRHVVDSTAILSLKEQPKRLAIIGGGNIGLEFASLYAKLGSQVVVYEAAPAILGRYEPTVAQLAKSYLEEDGVTFHLSASVEEISNDEAGQVLVKANGETKAFDVLLYAMGRKPATEKLGLEHTDIDITERGAIKVNDYCQTSVDGVYAVGDVTGGPQFTYTSLDDFRIVFGQLTGSSTYNHQERGFLPTTTFIEPPLSQIGLTEQEVQEKGLPYKANELLVANMPRAHVNNDLRGIFKVLINTDTKEILGATLLGAQSQEYINLIKMAMDNHIPYTYLKNQIFTHPSMAENLNDVFNI